MGFRCQFPQIIPFLATRAPLASRILGFSVFIGILAYRRNSNRREKWVSCSWHNFKGKFDTWQKCSWCFFCVGFQLLVRSKGRHNAVFETGSRISSHALRWCTCIYRGICLLSLLGRDALQPHWCLLFWGSESQSTRGANLPRPVLGTPDRGCHYVYPYGHRIFNTLLAYPQTIEETLNHRHFCFPQLE